MCCYLFVCTVFLNSTKSIKIDYTQFALPALHSTKFNVTNHNLSRCTIAIISSAACTLFFGVSAHQWCKSICTPVIPLDDFDRCMIDSSHQAQFHHWVVLLFVHKDTQLDESPCENLMALWMYLEHETLFFKRP